MSYIDDLVKLRFLAPMREAANSTLGNINTFQSKDIIKEFMDKIQTNPDGSGRPGGASGLDMSSPDSIAKLTGMETGTLGKLFEMSGGNMNTPESKGVQDISDRILKGMNVGSEMSSRAGTTAYQQGELKHGDAQIGIEKEKNRLEALGIPSKTALERAQAGYYNRMPKAGLGSEQKNAAEQQLQAEFQVTTMQSDNPIIVEDRGLILKAVQLPGNTLDNMRKQVAIEYPKMPQSQREGKVVKIINALGGDLQTAKQEAERTKLIKIQAEKDIKRDAAIAAKQKEWDEMDSMSKDAIVKKFKAASDNKNITDGEAESTARTTWMIRNLKELGIDTGVLENPLGLKFKPVTKRPLGGSGSW